MPKQRKWTNEQLISAVKSSASFRQVLDKLNLTGGGSQATIKKAVNDLGIDTSHFTGQLWSKGKTALDDARLTKKNIDGFFTENSVVSPAYIRKLLLKHKLIPYKCVCGIEDIWQETPISLQLDHIDGDRKNNSLDNLRFMCPNCHSQTPTYGGKNKGACGTGKVSDEDMIEALNGSKNIRQALLSVGLDNGRNYARAKRLKRKYGNVPEAVKGHH
jgi:hypothetical protein